MLRKSFRILFWNSFRGNCFGIFLDFVSESLFAEFFSYFFLEFVLDFISRNSLRISFWNSLRKSLPGIRRGSRFAGSLFGITFGNPCGTRSAENDPELFSEIVSEFILELHAWERTREFSRNSFPNPLFGKYDSEFTPEKGKFFFWGGGAVIWLFFYDFDSIFTKKSTFPWQIPNYFSKRGF